MKKTKKPDKSRRQKLEAWSQALKAKARQLRELERDLLLRSAQLERAALWIGKTLGYAAENAHAARLMQHRRQQAAELAAATEQLARGVIPPIVAHNPPLPNDNR